MEIMNCCNVKFVENIEISANDIDISGIIDDIAFVELNGIVSVNIETTNRFSGAIQINTSEDNMEFIGGVSRINSITYQYHNNNNS